MKSINRLLHILLAVIVATTAANPIYSPAQAAAATIGAPQKQTTRKKADNRKKSPKKTSSSARKATSGRSSSEVRREKKQTEAQLRETRRQQQLNTRLTEQHLNTLDLVEGEIGQCNQRINHITGHIDSLNRRINVVSDSINTLDNRLASISKNYAKALRKTQGRGQQTSMMAFIFSSDSFTEAYRRMNSVRQFDKWRKNKETEIGLVRSNLNDRRLSLTGLQQKHEKSRRELGNERNTLQKKQQLTAQLVDSLKTRGAELDIIMGQRARQAAQLDAELDNIAAREAAEKARAEAEAKARAEAKAKAEAEARARAEAEAKAKAIAQAEAKAAEKAEKAEKAKREVTEKKNEPRQSPAAKGVKHNRRTDNAKGQTAEVPPPPKRQNQQQPPVPPRPASKTPATGQTAPRLSTPTTDYGSGTATNTPAPSGSDFSQMQGSLMFPVTGRYTIVKRFGRQKHPKLPHIETTNSGLDIQTQPKAPVRTVFDGEVSAIFRPDGFNNVVVVRHGDYLTVYANLGQISVSNHQKVKAGQTIGTVYANPDDDGRSVLHFEIRHGRDKQDPELWLRR